MDFFTKIMELLVEICFKMQIGDEYEKKKSPPNFYF